jgi:succinyl-CoA synthetase beta subunit
LTIPLIVRLQGTKEAEAKKMITESGLKIYPFGESRAPVFVQRLLMLTFCADGLDEAAAKAVEMAK